MTSTDVPLRGDVWWIAFDPSIGGEPTKTRPAVVVSNDAANRLLNRIQVVPLTSAVDRVYPAEALVTLKGEKRKAMGNSIATVSKLRLRGWVARISSPELAAVERAIRIQLGL